MLAVSGVARKVISSEIVGNLREEKKVMIAVGCREKR
jgi:hypothetical protein